MDSKRKRVVSQKLIGYAVDKPGAYCPGCNVYVKTTDDGIVCSSCVAYWHYECAGIDADGVRELGENDFYCTKHKIPSICGGKNEIEKATDGIEKTVDEEIALVEEEVPSCSVNGTANVNIKSRSYTLNAKALCKKKLKIIDRKYKILPKDKGNQYSVHLNTVTYFILIKSMDVLGQKYGLEVKRLDVDQTGSGTQTQLEVIMLIDGEVKVSISLTCYHTSCTMLLKLEGKRGGEQWKEKIVALGSFADTIMVNMIETVEGMSEYGNVRTHIFHDLSTECDVNPGTNMSINLAIGDGRSCKISGNNKAEDLQVLQETDVEKQAREYAHELKITDNVTQVISETAARNHNKADAEHEIINHDNLVDPEISLGSVVKADESDTVIDNRASCQDSASVLTDVDSNKQVVVRKRTGNDTDKSKLLEAVGVLRKDDCMEETIRNLFSIMIRLKEKNLEMKSSINFVYEPNLYDRVNEMTIHLVAKQKEIENAKKACKELQIQVKDQKAMNSEKERKIKEGRQALEKKDLMINELNRDNEALEQKLRIDDNNELVREMEEVRKANSLQLSVISELEEDNKSKDEVISQLERDNNELTERCKSLMACEAELSSRVEVLQAINGHIGEGKDSELIVINNRNNKEEVLRLQEEINSLNEKVDKLNRTNSVLKDQVAVKTESLNKLDNFYKGILDEKDQTMNDLLTITATNSESEKNLRRLLVKYRSEQELKYVLDLKSAIMENSEKRNRENVEVAPSQVSVSTSTGDENQSEPNHTRRDETTGLGNTENMDYGRRSERDVQNPKQMKGLCKYGRICLYKDMCEYSHDPIDKPCRFGDNCKKLDACLFEHNDDFKYRCRENSENRGNWGDFEDTNTLHCSNSNVIRNSDRNPWIHTRNTSEGQNQGSYTNIHRKVSAGMSGEGRKRLCKNGVKCIDRDRCSFSHDMVMKHCKFGVDCTRLDRCLFKHDNVRAMQKIDGDSMNMWLISAKNGGGRA